MKKLNLLAILLSMAVITMTSCKKEEDDGGDGGNSGNGTMTLKYDGSGWSADLAVVASNSNGIVTVTGSDNNAHQAQVIVMNVSGTGTYDLGGSLTATNSRNGIARRHFSHETVEKSLFNRIDHENCFR